MFLFVANLGYLGDSLHVEKVTDEERAEWLKKLTNEGITYKWDEPDTFSTELQTAIATATATFDQAIDKMNEEWKHEDWMRRIG